MNRWREFWNKVRNFLFQDRDEIPSNIFDENFEAPLDASDIQFNPGFSSGNKVGVVYIVCNDYHSEESALQDHGKDKRNMKNFFDECEDNYYIAAERGTTSKKFLATCKYLAAYSKYPRCCDKIIIYFSGHGYGGGKNGDGYIIMEKDCGNIGNLRNVSSRDRERAQRVIYEQSKITIEQILSLLRKNDKIKEKMSRILLLDACCSAENVQCEENELVACAGSDLTKARSNCYKGGFWTDELCKMLDDMQSCRIEEVLKCVKYKMNTTLYPDSTKEATYLFPTFESKLKKEIYFKKKGMHYRIL